MTERACPVYLYSVLSSVTNTESRTQQEATHGPLYKQACPLLPNHCFQPAPWVFETLKSVGFSRQEHTGENMDEEFEFKSNRQKDFSIDFLAFGNIIWWMTPLIQF